MISVDIVIPCRNEVHHIPKMLADVMLQDYPSSLLNIYVIDGKSTDGTDEYIRKLSAAHANVHLLINEHKTTPHALNLGIRAGQGEIVARMDCHAYYPKNYISFLVENLQRLDADNVGVCLDTIPADESKISQGIALALSSRIGVGNSLFRVGSTEIRLVDTVPFGCYRREVFDKIGYFDEDLIRNQDDEFNSRLIKSGGRIFLLPGMRAQYFARNSISKLGKMYFQYGLFKPLSNLKSGRFVSLRQFVPSLFILVLISLAGLSLAWAPVLILFFLTLLVYETAVVSYVFFFMAKNSLGVKIAAVLSINTLHFCYGYGFLQGLVKTLFGWRGSAVEMTR